MVLEGMTIPTLSETEHSVHILVWLAQKRLQALGYVDWTADGIFGALTCRAVKAYQQDHGCEVTGKLDGPTWHCLLEREGVYE